MKSPETLEERFRKETELSQQQRDFARFFYKVNK